MANRRCFQTLTRCLQSIRIRTPLSETVAPYSAHALHKALAATTPNYISFDKFSFYRRAAVATRNFCSRPTGSDDDDDDDDDDEEEYFDDDDDDDDEEDYESSDLEESENGDKGKGAVVLSAEDKLKEASEIGYTVVGPLQKSDKVFKKYEPVFAVVQIGSHQFKVSNGDSIFTEKLKHCEVNDKLVLNKILMLGSQTQTIIGRPILPNAAVHAVVEEHALDAKVIVFKKKRRKNYRRTKGHRQELTKLRITDIQGIEKPKPSKNAKKKATLIKKEMENAKPMEA